MMVSAFVPYQSSLVHYRTTGEGGNLLFCFHGYGESSESFACLEKMLPASFVLVAIDLPFHGKTQWNDGLNCKPNDLITILQTIAYSLSREFDNISLIGFSMGARVALSLVDNIPDKINRLILLAPDGLKENFWYGLATQNVLGRRLFSFSMRHGRGLMTFTKAAITLGITNQSNHRLVMAYIHDRKSREELYRRWITMRSFRPSIPKLKKEIAENKISLVLVYGEQDRIIRPAGGKSLRKGIEAFCKVVMLAGGHKVLQEKNAATIIQLLKA